MKRPLVLVAVILLSVLGSFYLAFPRAVVRIEYPENVSATVEQGATLTVQFDGTFPRELTTPSTRPPHLRTQAGVEGFGVWASTEAPFALANEEVLFSNTLKGGDAFSIQLRFEAQTEGIIQRKLTFKFWGADGWTPEFTVLLEVRVVAPRQRCPERGPIPAQPTVRHRFPINIQVLEQLPEEPPLVGFPSFSFLGEHTSMVVVELPAYFPTWDDFRTVENTPLGFPVPGAPAALATKLRIGKSETRIGNSPVGRAGACALTFPSDDVYERARELGYRITWDYGFQIGPNAIPMYFVEPIEADACSEIFFAQFVTSSTALEVNKETSWVVEAAKEDPEVLNHMSGVWKLSWIFAKKLEEARNRLVGVGCSRGEAEEDLYEKWKATTAQVLGELANMIGQYHAETKWGTDGYGKNPELEVKWQQRLTQGMANPGAFATAAEEEH